MLVAGVTCLATMAAMAVACREEGSPSMGTEAVDVRLLAEPHALSMSTRDDFQVGIAATNRGTATIDPALDRARLLVNGKDFLAWSDAIGNGLREANWFELPPGETVSMSWSAMGELLFPTPGEYTLKLSLGNTESTPVVVRVRP